MEVPSSIDSIRDLLAFAYTYHGPNVNVEKLKGITEPLLELDRMVGLKTTKRTILDMIMHFVQGRHKKNEDYLHMVVCGPPGCGKTSFCRILGKILAGLRILSKDTFTIVKRTDLVAKYLGQTSHRTEELLNKCLGGVMFIDEAYQLAPRDSDRDSFSKEAIDFLNQFLSEHKDDLACIIAGYEEELDKTIFSMNEGLKRRFPWKFIIDPYTNEELLEIFNRMIEKIGYQVEEDAINATTFATNTEWFKFAGGDIETFITKCKFIHTRNTFGQPPNNIFSKQDIEDAIGDHKKHKKIISNDPPPGIYL
jgi:SpoVK/Ycf46/Vps4 family AAA+-type ATPase